MLVLINPLETVLPPETETVSPTVGKEELPLCSYNVFIERTHAPSREPVIVLPENSGVWVHEVILETTPSTTCR